MKRKRNRRKPVAPPGKTRYVTLMRRGHKLSVGAAVIEADRRSLVTVEAEPEVQIRKHKA